MDSCNDVSALRKMAVKREEVASAEAKICRFLLHGRLELPVSDMAELSTTTSYETRKKLTKLLMSIDINRLERLLRHIFSGDVYVPSPLHQTVPYLVGVLTKLPDSEKAGFQLAFTLFEKLPEEFLLFVRFYVESLRSETDDISALQYFIAKWYGRREKRAVAEMIAEAPVRNGWSHQDVVKRANLASKDRYLQAVFEYAKNGLRSLVENHHSEPEAEPVLEYFLYIESLKTATRPGDVLQKVVYTRVKNVHPSLIGDKNILKALIRRMDSRQLLKIIDTISAMNFFRLSDDSGWDLAFIRHVSYHLNNAKEIRRVRLHPCESFIARQSYLYKWKMVNEAAAMDEELLMMPEPLISEDVASALHSQMETAFGNLTKVDIDITVIIDPRKLQQRFCGDQGVVRCDRAAAFIALTLKYTGRSVRVFTFDGTKTSELNEEDLPSLSAAIESKVSSASSSTIASFVEKSSSDLVVVIGYSISAKKFSLNADQLKHKSKLVLCDLSEARCTSNQECSDTLISTGFRENTCDLITAFALYNFYRPPNPVRNKIAHIKRVLLHENDDCVDKKKVMVTSEL